MDRDGFRIIFEHMDKKEGMRGCRRDERHSGARRRDKKLIEIIDETTPTDEFLPYSGS